MNSNHAVATVADAAAKGLQFDLAKAYEACRKGIEEKTLAPWSGAAAGWIDDFYRRTDISLHFRKEKKKQTRMYIISKSVSQLQ